MISEDALANYNTVLIRHYEGKVPPMNQDSSLIIVPGIDQIFERDGAYYVNPEELGGEFFYGLLDGQNECRAVRMGKNTGYHARSKSTFGSMASIPFPLGTIALSDLNKDAELFVYSGGHRSWSDTIITAKEAIPFTPDPRHLDSIDRIARMNDLGYKVTSYSRGSETEIFLYDNGKVASLDCARDKRPTFYNIEGQRQHARLRELIFNYEIHGDGADIDESFIDYIRPLVMGHLALHPDTINLIVKDDVPFRELILRVIHEECPSVQVFESSQAHEDYLKREFDIEFQDLI